MKDPVPTLRAGGYYLRRRIPARYASVEHRNTVNICLSTDSLKEATAKGAEIWRQMVEAWEVKLDGLDAEGNRRLDAAMALAKRRGYRFMPVQQVAQLPLADLLARVESIVDKRGRLDLKEADAALGLAPVPGLTVSQAVDEFYAVAADRLVGKNDDQMRRHRAQRLKATRNFIEAIGDKSLPEITTDDIFEFRAYWLKRVAAGEVSAGTANKDFTYLTAMWRAVARAKSFALRFDTAGVALVAKGKKATRPPFSDSWIREKLMAPGALMGLNTDARLILLGMINTGYRPSEGAGLMARDIRLDAEVPHILIRPNDLRGLKNEHSERYIPLTGVSLDAFREAPRGFARYARNSATLSATINKFLAENKLLESPDHTLYGLRHAFEDRMLTGGVDERIRRDLMGHGLKREKYGKGGDMEHVHGLMAPLAL